MKTIETIDLNTLDTVHGGEDKTGDLKTPAGQDALNSKVFMDCFAGTGRYHACSDFADQVSSFVKTGMPLARAGMSPAVVGSTWTDWKNVPRQ